LDGTPDVESVLQAMDLYLLTIKRKICNSYLSDAPSTTKGKANWGKIVCFTK